jgi:hypothetical protein
MNACGDLSRNVDRRDAGFRSIDAIDDYTPGWQSPADDGRFSGGEEADA